MRIIAFDLDGTALDPRGQISCELRAEILRARSIGSYIVAATARPLRGLYEVEAIENLIDFAILCNGSHLMSFRPPTHVRKVELAIESLLQLIRDLESIIPGANIACDFDEVRLPLKRRSALSSGDWLREEFWSTKVEAFGQALRLDVSHKEVSVDDLYAILNQEVGRRYSVSLSGEHRVEVGPLGASKGSALAALADLVRVPRAEIAAIGDMLNDISMFKVAGFTAAVANAHKVVLDQADFVTEEPQERGVLEFFRSIRSDGH